MSNMFERVAMRKPQGSYFDELTHDVKMSLKMGKLYPVMVRDCLPGDRWKIEQEFLLRFAPLIAPVMHRMDVTIHNWFVPNRIIWPQFEQWITDPASVEVYPFVKLNDSTMQPDIVKAVDYFGLPDNTSQGDGAEELVSALPFAAYNKIYNEFYRDQNLVTELVDECNSGENVVPDLIAIQNRSWEHDYFTSCLPWPQKGASVNIPLGDVVLKSEWTTGTMPDNPNFVTSSGTNAAGAVGQQTGPLAILTGVDGPNAYDPMGTLQVDPTDINTLRRAYRLQEFLEKDARGGTRYVEKILVHFGIKSSDARLQRPEYISGTKSPVVISEVLNTTGEDAGLPQGNMAGHGISVSGGKSGYYQCEEHGWIISILSVMPKTGYQQGIERQWTKFDQLEHGWPEFANIGEQEVLNRELYAGENNGGNVFGYVPRYTEYKYIPNRTAGDFKTTLDFWHLNRIFGSAPALNQQFIECTPEQCDRIFAVQDGSDYLYMHLLHKINVYRLLSRDGIPSI